MRLTLLLCTIFFVFAFQSLQAQGPTLACNDITNFSLDGMGQGTITPEMILEGSFPMTGLEMTLEDGSDIVAGPAPTLDINCDLIGEYLITITHVDSGNACWGTIIIEDKLNVCNFGGNAIVVSNGFCGSYDMVLNNNETLAPIGQVCARILPDLNVGENMVSLQNFDVDGLNGVSTLDLVLMMRGIIFGFNSPVHAVLTDVDGDGTVSTIDLIKTRQCILLLEDPNLLAELRIFRVGDDYAGFDPYNIIEDYTMLTFEDSEFNSTSNIYVDVLKLGDLNNSALPGFRGDTESDTRSSIELIHSEKYLKAGEHYTIDFNIEHSEGIFGMTGGLDFTGIEVVDLYSDYSSQELMHSNLNDEVLFSFLSLSEEDEIRFSIELIAERDGFLSDLMSLSRSTSNDMVVSGNQVLNFALKGEKRFESDTHIAYPNPVNETLNVTFDTSLEGADKTLKLRNINGAVVYESTTSLNEYQVEMTNQIHPGMYILEIISNEKTSYLKVMKR